MLIFEDRFTDIVKNCFVGSRDEGVQDDKIYDYVHYIEFTMLPEYGGIADKYYQEWLIAFPTIGRAHV